MTRAGDVFSMKLIAILFVAACATPSTLPPPGVPQPPSETTTDPSPQPPNVPTGPSGCTTRARIPCSH
jgi:hypothetical protein